MDETPRSTAIWYNSLSVIIVAGSTTFRSIGKSKKDYRCISITDRPTRRAVIQTLGLSSGFTTWMHRGSRIEIQAASRNGNWTPLSMVCNSRTDHPTKPHNAQRPVLSPCDALCRLSETSPTKATVQLPPRPPPTTSSPHEPLPRGTDDTAENTQATAKPTSLSARSSNPESLLALAHKPLRIPPIWQATKAAARARSPMSRRW